MGFHFIILIASNTAEEKAELAIKHVTHVHNVCLIHPSTYAPKYKEQQEKEMQRQRELKSYGLDYRNYPHYISVGTHCFNTLVAFMYTHHNGQQDHNNSAQKNNTENDMLGQIVPDFSVDYYYHDKIVIRQRKYIKKLELNRFDTRKALYKEESLQGLIPDGHNIFLHEGGPPKKEECKAEKFLPAPCVEYVKEINGYHISGLLCEEEILRLKNHLGNNGTKRFEDMKHEYPANYRTSKRLMFISQSLADQLWARITGSFSQGPNHADWIHWLSSLRPRGIGTDGVWVPAGLNSFFRASRYDVGDVFQKHQDVRFCRPPECSILSLVIYLNSEFEGGTTDFYEQCVGEPLNPNPDLGTENPTVRITPVCASAILFPHWIPHAGSPVTRGTKLILRADVMFRKVWLLDPNLLAKEKELYLTSPEYYRIRYHFRESVLACQRKTDPGSATDHFLAAASVEAAASLSHKKLRLQGIESHQTDRVITACGNIRKPQPHHGWPHSCSSGTGAAFTNLYEERLFIGQYLERSDYISLSETSLYFYNWLYTENGWNRLFKIHFPRHARLCEFALLGLSNDASEVCDMVTSSCHFYARKSCWSSVSVSGDKNHSHKNNNIDSFFDIGPCTFNVCPLVPRERNERVLVLARLYHHSHELDQYWTQPIPGRNLRIEEVEFLRYADYKSIAPRKISHDSDYDNDDNDNDNDDDNRNANPDGDYGRGKHRKVTDDDTNYISNIFIDRNSLRISCLAQEELLMHYPRRNLSMYTSTEYPIPKAHTVENIRESSRGTNAIFVQAPALIMCGAIAERLVGCHSAVAVVHVGNFKNQAWISLVNGLYNVGAQAALFPELEIPADDDDFDTTDFVKVAEIVAAIQMNSRRFEQTVPMALAQAKSVENVKLASQILERLKQMVVIASSTKPQSQQHQQQPISHLILSGINVPSVGDFEAASPGLMIIGPDPDRLHKGASYYWSMRQKLFKNAP